MKFRTEIEPAGRGVSGISHSDSLLMLGSCFTDNVGERLKRDGFDVTANPMGPLYNPQSIARVLGYLIDGKTYGDEDLTADGEGIYHCLDYASRYQSADKERLIARLQEEFDTMRCAYEKASVVILTFGSSIVYTTSESIDDTVGNCHKFPATMFHRLTISAEQAEATLRPILNCIKAAGKRVIVTVSPIRHLADGLHGNQLSKARLLLMCDRLGDVAEYFSSYEIMLDDLRDYRFYATDMKHPSETACDYIYEQFAATYFSAATAEEARRRRSEYLRSCHRPIIGEDMN